LDKIRCCDENTKIVPDSLDISVSNLTNSDSPQSPAQTGEVTIGYHQNTSNGYINGTFYQL
jgi:hypothetical protein